MALGKLTIVIGAGLIGSVLTSKDGGMSDVVNLFSGAFKIVTKHLKQEKGGSGAKSQPQTNALLEQINKLRDELQRAKPSEKLIIVSGSRSGYGGIGVKAVIVIGVTGYIVLWWKGWKLSNFMFVTRRGFSDAVNKVAKQLDSVSASVSAAKRHLTSRIDRVDINLEECKEITTATKDEVSKLHEDLSSFHTEVESVHRVVQTLETKLSRIEGSQEYATQGVYHLCQFVEKLENNRNKEATQGLPSSSLLVPGLLPAASAKALPSSSQETPGLPPAAPVLSKAISLPPLSLDAPLLASPSAAVETPRVLLPSMAVSPSGLKNISSISSLGSSRSPFVTRDISEVKADPIVQPKSNAPRTGLAGWTLGILSRSQSTK